MNLLIMDDFPTAWSPRKTILYLSTGGIVFLLTLRLLMFVIDRGVFENISVLIEN